MEKRAAGGEEGERLLWSVAGLALQFKVKLMFVQRTCASSFCFCAVYTATGAREDGGACLPARGVYVFV